MAHEELLEWIDEDEVKAEMKKRHKRVLRLSIIGGLLLGQVAFLYAVDKWEFSGSDPSAKTKKGKVADSDIEMSSMQPTVKGEDGHSREHQRASNSRGSNGGRDHNGGTSNSRGSYGGRDHNGGTSNLRGSNGRSSNLRGSNGKSSNLRGSNGKSSNLRGSNGKSPNLRGSNGKIHNGRISNPSIRNVALKMATRIRALNLKAYTKVAVGVKNNRIKNIDIHTNSSAWNAMKEQEKVDLLNKTALFLRTDYPGMEPSVTLRFGDQKLELKSTSLALDYLIKTFKQSFRDLNPKVYKAVDVEFEGKEVMERSGRVVWDDLRIRKIDIRTYSRSWDAMLASKRVDLINETMFALKMQSPGTTPFITLKFDDRRKDLKLKYKSRSVETEAI